MTNFARPHETTLKKLLPFRKERASIPDNGKTWLASNACSRWNGTTLKPSQNYRYEHASPFFTPVGGGSSTTKQGIPSGQGHAQVLGQPENRYIVLPS